MSLPTIELLLIRLRRNTLRERRGDPEVDRLPDRLVLSGEAALEQVAKYREQNGADIEEAAAEFEAAANSGAEG